MTGRNPWAVLGVAEGASCQDVRRAFRRRAKESHPDRGGDAREFAAVMRAVEDLRHLVAAPRSLPGSPAPEGAARPPSPTPYDPWLRPAATTRTWGGGCAPAPGVARRGHIPGAEFAAVLTGEMARVGAPAS